MINLSSLFDARHNLSSNPLSFIDSDCKITLSNIMDLIIVESSNQRDILVWQKKQLQNLLKHSINKSSIWRKRLVKKDGGIRNLKDIPAMSREVLNEQVSVEGSLLGINDGVRVTKHSTSGSTGFPAIFYVTNINANYNAYRSVAQLIMDERNLSLNRTRLGYGALASKQEAQLTTRDRWLDHLYPLIESGKNKEIAYLNPSIREIDRILRELKKDPIGLLLAGPWMIEPILRNITPKDLYKYGARVCLVYGGRLNDLIIEALESANISVTHSYSCEEVGPVAFECIKSRGCYHIAASNVIAEVDDTQSLSVEGKSINKLLITHLHSYATPFIRYEIGDYAKLSRGCKCGFEGPVLNDIYGRSKMLLSKPGGNVVPFFIETAYLFDLADIKEYRIRQVSLDRLEAEFIISDSCSDAQRTNLSHKLKLVVGDDIDVNVSFVKEINWGLDVKRQGFRNETINFS